MSALVVAVDPGLSGAVAVLSADGALVHLADLPIARDHSLAWIDGGRLQSELLEAIAGRPCRAYVERVGAMPGQGVSSCFTFGAGLGSILAVLQTLRLPLELISPATWKRALGLPRDKGAALDRARLLFPSAELHLKRHDGRAEALLLAYHALTRRPA